MSGLYSYFLLIKHNDIALMVDYMEYIYVCRSSCINWQQCLFSNWL